MDIVLDTIYSVPLSEHTADSAAGP
jgi:hypothetical protein